MRRFMSLVMVAAMTGLGLAQLSPVGAAAASGVTVSPGRAAPGAVVKVSGDGFSGDCGVLVHWGSAEGVALGGAKVAKDGSFKATVKLPTDVPAGAGTLAVAGRRFGQSGCAAASGKVASGGVTVTDAKSPYARDIVLLDRMVRAKGVDASVAAAARGSSKAVHAIVQLNRLPKAGDLKALAALGVRPLAYLSSADGFGSAYLATLQPDFRSGDARFGQLVRAVSPLKAIDKVEVGLAAKLGAKSVETTILFFSDVSVADADAVLAKAGVDGRRKSADTVVAPLSRAQTLRLANEDGVQFLAARSPEGLLELDTSRAMVNVDQVQDLDVATGTYLGLSGLGVQISIHDSGIDNHHNDFAGRIDTVLHPGNAAGNDHGTHVASIAAGSGVMSNQNDDANNPNNGTAFQWRGMAPQAGLTSYGSTTGDDAGTMEDAVVDDGADVSNHSYGYQVSGVYDADQADIDDIIRGDVAPIPARPMVFSAGNGGQNAQFGMNSGYFGLTKACKNCIMVANLQDNQALNGGSSHGPTTDGRLKPDLAANGTSVIAAEADITGNTGNGYIQMGGTSMATPVVTGSIALLLQQYAEQFGVDIDTNGPLPSTLKAILVETATDLAGTASGTNPDTGAATTYGAGPDWATGYGLVNTLAASELMAAELFLEDAVAMDDVTDEHLASVVPGQDELRITLAWDDLPGAPNANHAAPMLVNDLDLMLIGPNGEVVRPLVAPAAAQFDCDGNAGNGTQTGTCTPGADPGPFGGVAAQGTDRLNNLEQVVVANPAPGKWRARVSVLNTDASIRLPLGGTQSYSLAGLSDARADLSVTKSDSPDPATAGDQLFYTISVTNNGPDDAENVTVVDVLPTGVTYVTNDLPGGCVEAPAGTLTCSVGDIKAGTTKSFKIKVHIDPDLVSDNGEPLSIFNTATAWSNTVDPDTSNNSDTEGTIVEDLADIEVAKMCKPDRPLLAGEVGHCTVFIDNHGPSFARDVRVENVVLSDGDFTIAAIDAGPGAVCTPVTAVSGGKKFSCNIGDLAPASSTASGRRTIFYEVSATEEVDINDKASASSDTPDPNYANNSATEHISVTAVADLSIDKTGPGSVIAGENATYDLSITNDGPSTAKGVVITDTLSAGVTILSVTGSNGATCNAGTPGVAALPTTCSFGDLAPGATRTMTIEVKVLPGTRGVIHNDARVSSATFDDDLSDNLDTVATVVNGSADLSVTKSGSPDPVVAGQPITYTIVVTNAGPSTATDVKIEDTIPAGTSFVSGVDGNGATVCALVQPGKVVCELGDMAPGASTTVYLTLLVAANVPDGTVLHNSVTVSSSTPDPNPGNNTAGDDTNVITSADLWLDKQGTKRSGNPSPIVTYTLVVHNDQGCETDAQSTVTPTCGGGGPSDAQSIVVTDQLPLDPKKFVVQYVSPQCTYDKPTHKLTCTVPTLPAGQSVSFVVEAQVAGSVGLITNTAQIVSSATPDPVAANNTNTVTLVMKGGTGKR